MPRLYIGNLPRRIEERDIKKFFREYGRIRSVDLKNGYGFVEIDDRRDAEDAIHDLDGTKLLGERVTVEMARSNARFGGGGADRGGGGDRGGRGFDNRNNRYDSRDSRDRYNSRKPIRSEHRIIVDGLSSRVSWQDLKDLMRKVGEVTFADAHKLRQNQGVVEFSNNSDMKAAIDKYDGYELYGYNLKVYEDRGGGIKRKSRSRSYHRRRSSSRSKRSASKSRSRSRSKSSRKRSRSRRRSSSRKRSDSRKRSRSNRSNSRKSRSAKSYSKSKSPVQKWAVEDENDSKSKSKSVSRSRSRSLEKKDSPKSRSKSLSKEREERSVSRSRSRSRSISKSRSRSNSPGEQESVKSACSDVEDRPNPEEEASNENINDENMDSN